MIELPLVFPVKHPSIAYIETVGQDNRLLDLLFWVLLNHDTLAGLSLVQHKQ